MNWMMPVVDCEITSVEQNRNNFALCKTVLVDKNAAKLSYADIRIPQAVALFRRGWTVSCHNIVWTIDRPSIHQSPEVTKNKPYTKKRRNVLYCGPPPRRTAPSTAGTKRFLTLTSRRGAALTSGRCTRATTINEFLSGPQRWVRADSPLIQSDCSTTFII